MGARSRHRIEAHDVDPLDVPGESFRGVAEGRAVQPALPVRMGGAKIWGRMFMEFDEAFGRWTGGWTYCDREQKASKSSERGSRVE